MKKFPGIYKNKNSISIHFSLNGKQVKRTKKYIPNDQNCRLAYKLRCEIIDSIEKGTFDLEDFDRNNGENKIKKTQKHTLKYYVKKFLTLKSTSCSPTTMYGYSTKASQIIKIIGNIAINKINPIKVQEFFNKFFKHLSNKTKNEMLIVFRGAIKTAELSSLKLPHKSSDYIQYKTSVKEPDPYDYKDLKCLLKTSSHEHEKNIFHANMYIGLRPSELLGLGIEDIDFKNKELTVNRCIVLNGIIKVPKTKSSERTIELNDAAIYFLKKGLEVYKNTTTVNVVVLLRNNVDIKTESFSPVLFDSDANSYYNSSSSLNKKIKVICKECDLEYKPVIKCRQTYASNALSLGASVIGVAADLGHANHTILEDHYAKNIKSRPSKDIINKYVTYLNEKSR